MTKKPFSFINQRTTLFLRLGFTEVVQIIRSFFILHVTKLNVFET